MTFVVYACVPNRKAFRSICFGFNFNPDYCEMAVPRRTADGKTSGEISDILNIAERAVNFHINNAVTKLNAANRISAAVSLKRFVSQVTYALKLAAS